MADEAESSTFTRELGVSEQEFFRMLPPAIENRPFVRDGRTVRLEVDGHTVTFELGPEQTRRLGMLELPYMEVTFGFGGLPPEARARFMERFQLYFRRGGG